MDIPTPSRGYWAQVAQGNTRPIKPLPAAQGKPEAAIFYQPQVVHKRSNLPSMDPADFKQPLHHLVRETVRSLQNSDDRRRSPVLEMYVKPWRTERAAALLSALFYAAERQGHEVAIVRRDESYSSMFVVDGENINFYLAEKLQYRRDPNSSEEDPKPRNMQVQALEFNFRLWQCPHEGKTSWKDSRRVPLEEQLDEILGELIPLGASVRSHRLELERQRAERAENERRAHAAKDQLNTLKRDIQGYRFAEEVRAFVARARQFYEGREDSEYFSKWRAWASVIADQNDPFIARQNDPLARYFRLHDQLWYLFQNGDDSG